MKENKPKKERQWFPKLKSQTFKDRRTKRNRTRQQQKDQLKKDRENES